MPYAYGANINHVFDTDHLNVYVTFRHPMQRSAIPQASPPVYDWYPLPAVWLLEADEVPVDIIGSEWLDEHTLLLTSDTIASEPTGVTLEYDGPDVKLTTTWGKQWETWGPIPSYAGYPTAPALHKSTHENGGADEINIAGLSGLAADTQPSFVDRGDTADYDFEVSNFTADGNWHDLDLSGIIGIGAKAVLFTIIIQASDAQAYLILRKKGQTYFYNSTRIDTQVAGIANIGDLISICDSNRVVEYLLTAGGVNVLDLTVKGWFL